MKNFSLKEKQALLVEDLDLNIGLARDGLPYFRQIIHTDDESDPCLSKLVGEAIDKNYKI